MSNSRADIAQLKLTQLRYAAAAQDFQEAANRVPAGELLVRSGYLNSLGVAAERAGNYPLAGPALAEALSIRERMLRPDHPNVATSLNNLADLYSVLGRHVEAEPLYTRALAIYGKALGPFHPESPPASTTSRGCTLSRAAMPKRSRSSSTQNKVAPEDLDAKLREVAARHLTLLKQTEASADDDPQVAAIKREAIAAIGAGDYERAEDLLQRADDADLAGEGSPEETKRA
jgi:tetratricopeptide (TPR) repeat protein